MPPPPAPAFDYYAELEVSSSATLQDITAAYRRLARVYHPDKNPTNQDVATAKFQKVQQAYETLSSTAGRNRYDTLSQPRGTCTCGHCFDEDDYDDGDWYSDYEDDDDYYYDFPFGSSGPRPFFSSGQRHGGFTFGGSRFHSYEDMEKFFQEQERKEAERIKILAEERRQREAADAARRKAKEDEKKAEEEALKKAEEAWKAEERRKQEERWKEAGAVTRDEKLKMCLHSDFCVKVPQKKKFKCGLCAKKGGMMAFECPYCSSFLCQQCLTKYQRKRENDEYSIIPKPKSKPNPEPEPKSDEEAVEPEPEPEPAAEPESEPLGMPKPKAAPTIGPKQQQPPDLHNGSCQKPPQKDVEDKSGGTNGQASKKAKKNRKGIGLQSQNGSIPEPEPSISIPAVKVIGKLGQPSTKKASPATNGISRPDQTQMQAQIPQPQVNQLNGHTARNHTVDPPIQKLKPQVNGWNNKNVVNGTPPPNKPAPKSNGIPGLHPFPPPAPELLQPDAVSEDQVHVNQDLDTSAVPTGPMRARKPLANGPKPQSGFSCYICGGQHLARNCSQPRSCYNCGGTGHLAKHCVRTNAVNEWQPAGSFGVLDPRMTFPDFITDVETQPVVTKAAIRGATLARGITGPLLRQAMECFGPVTECEIDRKAGIAWVVFVEGEALRNSIAASPVPVAQGAVRLSEWTGGY
ncbi:hypothetical protein TruAng_008601 [Truncatella angustata]|nr:hypothetical protein TruAng_008601 [Truncatella angustata]